MAREYEVHWDRPPGDAKALEVRRALSVLRDAVFRRDLSLTQLSSSSSFAKPLGRSSRD